MGRVRLGGGSIFGRSRRRRSRRMFLTFKVVSMPAKAGITALVRSPLFWEKFEVGKMCQRVSVVHVQCQC